MQDALYLFSVTQDDTVLVRAACILFKDQIFANAQLLSSLLLKALKIPFLCLHACSL
jgi:hypothetical protein